MPALRSIAVGMDGSPSSEKAFEWALELAKIGGASLAIVGAIPVLPYLDISDEHR